ACFFARLWRLQVVFVFLEQLVELLVAHLVQDVLGSFTRLAIVALQFFHQSFDLFRIFGQLVGIQFLPVACVLPGTLGLVAGSLFLCIVFLGRSFVLIGDLVARLGLLLLVRAGALLVLQALFR